jgi:ankyrin repeat protein
MSAMMHAAKNGHVATVHMLIETGASTALADCNGWTALIHAAAHDDDAETVQRLLDAAADASVKNAAGDTALDVALEKDHDEVVAILSTGTDQQQVDVEARAMFEKYDRDSNGVLDLEEVGALLRDFGTFSEEAIRERFKTADVNADGVVVFDEYMVMFHTLMLGGGVEEDEEALLSSQPQAGSGATTSVG